MASLNMAKVNTLIRKGYLLAVVVIVANMFIGNYMKAMEMEKDKLIDDKDRNGFKEIKMEKENSDSSETQSMYILNKVLTYENTINFFGGLFFSVANNYLKLWDYNPGGYWNLRIGCFRIEI